MNMVRTTMVTTMRNLNKRVLCMLLAMMRVSVLLRCRVRDDGNNDADCLVALDE